MRGLLSSELRLGAPHPALSPSGRGFRGRSAHAAQPLTDAPSRPPSPCAGLRIGLFGGSFNPPHAGHRLVTLIALRRLRLDAVWWIVTPGNPLKDTRGLPPQRERMAAARRLMPEPKVAITGFEAEIGTPYTLDTLRYLKRRCRASASSGSWEPTT